MVAASRIEESLLLMKFRRSDGKLALFLLKESVNAFDRIYGPFYNRGKE
jgi:hypothetical protein